METHGSPEYAPVSGLWSSNLSTAHTEAHAQGILNNGRKEIAFGPGVRLSDDAQLAAISDQVTKMDIDAARLHHAQGECWELALALRLTAAMRLGRRRREDTSPTKATTLVRRGRWWRPSLTTTTPSEMRR